MRAGRRTPLAASAAAVGVACAVTPLLTWLTANGHKGHCGWTCYVPTTRPVSIAALGGRGGMQVAPLLGGLLFVVAVLSAVALVGVLRSPNGPPVALGWLITAVGFGGLVGTVVVIVRYAEGGTMVRTSADGIFSANPGPGAVLGLVATAGAVLLGGAIALRAGTADAGVGSTEADGPGTRSLVGDPSALDPRTSGGDVADTATDGARYVSRSRS